MYYKVVYDYSIDEEETVFTSAVVEGDANVLYTINEWATAPAWLAAKGYHLLVFANKESAFSFGGRRHKVFRCAVQGPVKLPPQLILDRLEYKLLPQVEGGGSWPEHTLMFEKVKLLERMAYSG